MAGPAATPWLASSSALLTVGMLTVVGCTPSEESDAAPSSTNSPVGADPPSSPSPEPESPEPFTVAFGGDVMFEGILRERLDADPESAMGPVADIFHDSDLSMVNLETAVTERGTPADKDFVFRAPPTAYDALRAAGVDVASVANNHGMDYGEEGMHDTLDHAEAADFPIVGIGRNADEAYSPHITEVNGNTVAILGATDVLDAHVIPTWTAGDDQPGLASTKDEALERMLEAVADAGAEADTVITYLHWGMEGSHCPLPHAPDLARQLIDAGADVVVGGHAHVLSPGGYYGDAYVHFGLGNFVFYNFSGPTAETGVLQLTMLGDEVLEDEWLPGQIEGGIPILYEGEAAESAVQAWVGHRETCDAGLVAESG